jgi:hypothetical protein
VRNENEKFWTEDDRFFLTKIIKKKEINHRGVKQNEEASHRISGFSDSEK